MRERNEFAIRDLNLTVFVIVCYHHGQEDAWQDFAAVAGGYEVDIKKRLSVDAMSVTSDDGTVTPRRGPKPKKFATPEEQLRSRLWAVYRAVHDYKVLASLDMALHLPR